MTPRKQDPYEEKMMRVDLRASTWLTIRHLAADDNVSVTKEVSALLAAAVEESYRKRL
jgi:hypothetical protein